MASQAVDASMTPYYTGYLALPMQSLWRAINRGGYVHSNYSKASKPMIQRMLNIIINAFVKGVTQHRPGLKVHLSPPLHHILSAHLKHNQGKKMTYMIMGRIFNFPHL